MPHPPPARPGLQPELRQSDRFLGADESLGERVGRFLGVHKRMTPRKDVSNKASILALFNAAIHGPLNFGPIASPRLLSR